MNKLITTILITLLLTSCSQKVATPFKDIPDSTRILDLHIVGSHDSGAIINGGDTLITQDLDIPQQLAIGIRAFDIRLRATKGERLTVFHQDANQDLEWERDLVPLFMQFLRKHPREFLIIMIKKEGPAIRTHGSYETLLHSSLSELEPSHKIVSSISPSTTLREIRGKMIILHRDSLSAHWMTFQGWQDNTAFEASITKNNDTIIPIYVQDQYLITRHDASDKEEAFIGAVHAKAMRDSVLLINYLSGTGKNCTPREAAIQLTTDSTLCKQNYPPGIYMLDFCGSTSSRRLINHLYQSALIQ